MKLVWKQVVGFGGSYEVSNTGLVRSVDRQVGYRIKGHTRFSKGKVLKQWLNSWGYYFVVLAENNNNHTKMVHRLVLESFLSKPPAKKPPSQP